MTDPSTDPLAGVSDERLAMFVREQLPSRPLTVQISRANERRLRRSLVTVNRDLPDDPIAFDDEGLGHALMGAADGGLRMAEEEDGVWTDLDGRAYDLPRPVRAPVMMRLKFAWRAASSAWRAS